MAAAQHPENIAREQMLHERWVLEVPQESRVHKQHGTRRPHSVNRCPAPYIGSVLSISKLGPSASTPSLPTEERSIRNTAAAIKTMEGDLGEKRYGVRNRMEERAAKREVDRQSRNMRTRFHRGVENGSAHLAEIDGFRHVS